MLEEKLAEVVRNPPLVKVRLTWDELGALQDAIPMRRRRDKEDRTLDK